ncbi:MAG: inositol monophosphatase family protein [Candidatus Acidiferrales bacterium]|jgi:myo-inositol-1(or 4)-monophosphatase
MAKTFLEVAVQTALEAGEILAEEFARPVDISYKGDVDLVTQADRRSEQAIVARLGCEFPEHAILAEEGSGHESKSRYRWYVDPLDGTTNFAHGYPCFAVSIGLAEDDRMIAAVVHNPIGKELFAAERGKGAALNGRRIRVSQIDRLSRSLLVTGFPTHKRTQNPNIYYYWDFTLQSHGVRRDGSAALDLAAVAAGRFEGFWEFGLKPWDTAAGVLLVEEAGGRVTDFDGQPYPLGGPVLLASNGLVHAEMQKVAAEVVKKKPLAGG